MPSKTMPVGVLVLVTLSRSTRWLKAFIKYMINIHYSGMVLNFHKGHGCLPDERYKTEHPLRCDRGRVQLQRRFRTR